MTAAFSTATPIVQASFSWGDEIRFDGYHNPSIRWNGFACPWFTQDVVEQMIAHSAQMATEIPPEDVEIVTWETGPGGNVVVTSHSGTENAWTEVITSAVIVCDGVKITAWSVGSFGWTWDESA